MGFLYQNSVSKTSSSNDSKYPSWVDGKPNLLTYLDALNLSNPIVQCQYELVYSRWPRTIFFAKNITIPGVSTNTIEISHAGFTIPIPTHVKYNSNEITINIIADKEGFHYFDWRNIVLQNGHPLVAGDTRSTVSAQEKISEEDQLEIRLRNSPNDITHHHWIVHNFRPTKIGDVELSQDGGSFVQFEITGTFTHIYYDAGKRTSVDKTSIPEDQTGDNYDYEPSEQEKKVAEIESKIDSTDSDLDSSSSKLDSSSSELNYNELDSDTRDALDLIKQGGVDDPTLKNRLALEMTRKHPTETTDEQAKIASKALSTAKKYLAQEQKKAEAEAEAKKAAEEEAKAVAEAQKQAEQELLNSEGGDDDSEDDSANTSYDEDDDERGVVLSSMISSKKSPIHKKRKIFD